MAIPSVHVTDPNVIGSMTGHIEDSRAFAMYRTIDEEVKKRLVDILGAQIVLQNT